MAFMILWGQLFRTRICRFRVLCGDAILASWEPQLTDEKTELSVLSFKDDAVYTQPKRPIRTEQEIRRVWNTADPDYFLIDFDFEEGNSGGSVFATAPVSFAGLIVGGVVPSKPESGIEKLAVVIKAGAVIKFAKSLLSNS